MDTSKLILTALKFNEKINQRDLEGLAELMTDDHTFIDNSGEVTKGKDAMKEDWREFFESYPAPTMFSETNTNHLALFLFSKEFGVFPPGFFYF